VRARRDLSNVFRWPFVIAAVSVVGLLSALMADGVWDGVSWLALSIPVAVGVLKSRAGSAARHSRQT
jgi:hypothetical protein